METNEYSAFYQSLSPLEKEYWHRFDELFQQVQPQRPEKGIQALLLRAKRHAQMQNISVEEALQKTFNDAAQRTHRRVELLKQCRLPDR